VTVLRTDVSKEYIASIFRVERISQLRSVIQLLVTAAVSISLILAAVMMEAIRSSETWLLTRATRRNIPEDGIVN
jgi:hypothetical protein